MAKMIRTPQVAAENWKTRTGAASQFYVDQAKAAQWKVFAGSDAAEKNYATAIQEAVAKKTRQAQIAKVSDQEWQQGVEKNSARFGQGVTDAEPKMQNVMGKLLPAIDSARKALPASGVRGSQANIQRAVQFMTEMSKKRGQFR